MADEAPPAPAAEGGGKKPYNPDPNAMPAEGESSGCCGKHDPHKKAEPHKCPTSIDRGYTDCLALLMLLGCWVITTGVGVMAMNGGLLASCGADGTSKCTGNALALLAPTDYKGRMCGVDSSVEDQPYGYIVDKYGDMVCVEECPSTTAIPDLTKSAYTNLKDYCMTSAVSDSYKNAGYDSTKGQDYATLLGTSSDGSTYLEGPCMMELASYPMLYYCAFNVDAKFPTVDGFPYSNMSVTQIITGNGKSASSYLADFISDLVITRNAIFGFGFAVALIVAFVYSYLMTLGLVDCVVWSCILLTFAMFFGLGGYMYQTYTEWDAANCDIDDGMDDAGDCTGEGVAHSDTEIDGMMYMSYVFFGLAALWVAFIACICSKIRLACAFVRVAGTAVRDMPIVLFFPMVQIAGLLLFLTPWMYYMAYVHSQGTYLCTNSCSGDDTACNGMKDGKTYDCDLADVNLTTTKYSWEWADASIGSDQDLASSFMMFSYFWTSQFILAMGQLVMAMTFVLWYFAGFDADQKEKVAVETAKAEGETIEPKKGASCCYKLICGDPDNYRGNGLFFKGLHLVLYHVGTAAAGSLVIAIIQFIRYMVAKIQAQCNKSLTGTLKTIANIVLCCIQCCLYCLEKCMKFINKHAYIITATSGKSFCAAACESFWLIVRNIRLIAALTMVQEFSIIVGKVLIIMVTGALSYMYMASGDLADQANSLIGPTIFVMILAYFMADMFLTTYSMAMDVMMHCYLSDKEANSPMWAVNEKATHLKPLADVIGSNAPKDDDKDKENPAAEKE